MKKQLLLLGLCFSLATNTNGNWEVLLDNPQNLQCQFIDCSGDTLFLGNWIVEYSRIETHHSGSYLYSTDDGITWSECKYFYDHPIQYFYRLGNRVFLHTWSGLYRMDDCYIPVEIPGNNYYFRKIFFHNDYIYIFENNNRTVMISEDWGITWQSLQKNIPDSKFYILNHYDDLFYISTKDHIYTSNDGCDSWQVLNFPSISGTVTGMKKFNTDIYFYTNNGLIVKSTDNGLSWMILNDSNRFNRITDLIIGKNYLIVLEGLRGISLSTDSGSTWNNILNKYLAINSIGIKSGYIYAAGQQGLYRAPLTDFNINTVEDNQTKQKSGIYPNPVTSHITIYLDDEGTDIKDIKIFDCTGRPVRSVADYSVSGNTVSLDVPGLEAGAYYLSLSTARGRTMSQFVKTAE